MPASDMNRMAARWIEVPEFEDAQLISPGRALARDTSSCTDLTGTDGCTAITLGAEARSATGANALSPSYGSLRSSGLMVRCEPGQEDGVSIRRRPRHHLGPDDVVAPGPEVHDDMLAEAGPQSQRHRARD